MKIVIIHNLHRSGSSSGDDVVFKKETEILETNGHTVVRYNPSNDEYDRVGLLKRLLIGLQIPWSVNSYKRIKKILSEEKPDIAHVHNFFPLLSPSIYDAICSEGIPVVQTLHDFRFLCGMAYFMRDGSICDECKDGSFLKSIKYGCFKNSKIQTTPVALMLKLHHMINTFKNKIDAYICLTDSQKRIFSGAGFEFSKLFVKPNFVEDTYRPSEDNRGDFVIFIGRLGVEKGIKILIEAWKGLPEIPLKIVGTSPEAKKIEALVGDLNLRNIDLMGYRPYHECMKILGEAKFLVMPSIWYETFGLTIVEAFSKCKPVIASKHGAMVDIVKDGETGLLFTPKDTEALADKVKLLWDNPGECLRLGLNARKEYEAKYTPEKNYEMLFGIYKEVIERKKEDNELEIVFIGSRGIPGMYGGFETFAERLAVELVARGHKVTVYGQYDKEKNFRQGTYKGVECFNFSTPAKRALQKPVLSFKATFHSLKLKTDIAFFLGVSAAPFNFINHLVGMKTVVNLDGLEWKRAKWGPVGRLYLHISEWLSAKTCHVVVADSKVLVDIYRRLYSINSVYIPYGADVLTSVPSDAPREMGLEPGKYVLQCCRLEPENNVHLVIEGYLKSKMELPLVILGDAPLGNRYKEKLFEIARGKVRFLGAVYGSAYKQIVAHAGLYIHAHEVGGTNPSLLEAMAFGKAPLYLDVPFNREVAGEVGFPFPKDSTALAYCINNLIARMEEVKARADNARKIINERYSWSSVVDEYESLFKQLLEQA